MIHGESQFLWRAAALAIVALSASVLGGCSNGIDLSELAPSSSLTDDAEPDADRPDLDLPIPDVDPTPEPEPEPEPEGVDLAVESLKLKQHPVRGGRISTSAIIANRGNEAVNRTLKIGVEVWHATRPDAPMWSTFQEKFVALDGGQEMSWELPLVLPDTFGSATWSIRVIVDADAHLNDVNRDNNSERREIDYTNRETPCPLGPGAVCPWVDLTGQQLQGLNLTGAYLVGANMRGLSATGALFDGADLTGADLRGANLTGSSFRDATLAESELNAASLSSCILERADLTRAVIKRADLNGANLRDAVAREALFDGATMEGAMVERTNWRGAVCPDGTRSEDHDNTCEGHLIP